MSLKAQLKRPKNWLFLYLLGSTIAVIWKNLDGHFAFQLLGGALAVAFWVALARPGLYERPTHGLGLVPYRIWDAYDRWGAGKSLLYKVSPTLLAANLYVYLQDAAYTHDLKNGALEMVVATLMFTGIFFLLDMDARRHAARIPSSSDPRSRTGR